MPGVASPFSRAVALFFTGEKIRRSAGMDRDTWRIKNSEITAINSEYQGISRKSRAEV
jgi:hypothetical protein